MKLRNSLLALGAFLVVACGSANAADSMAQNSMWAKETVKVSKNATITVSSELGDVKIRTWNHDKVIVRSEAVHGTFVVDASSDGSTVNIKANGYGTVDQTTAAVHVIYVPETAVLVLGPVNGDVTIDDPSRNLTVNRDSQSAPQTF